MQRNKVNRILALALSAVMAAGLVGCQSGGNNSQSAPEKTQEEAAGDQKEQEASDSGSQDEGSGDAESENISFSVFGNIWAPYPESSDIYDKWQEETNTTINFEWTQADSFETQLAAKVSSQDLPDVILTETPQSLIDEGVLVPITEYLEKDCPNFMGMLNDADMAYLTNVNDQEVYGMALIMDIRGAYSTAIRSDWLDNLGLEQPKTWEEWVNVWTKFKQEDANGNGNANDEIPLAVEYANFYMLESIFGINSNGYFSVENGEYIYDPENPKYEAFLDGMRQLYADGILYQEYITCDAAQLSTIGSNNTLGTMVNWAEQAKLLALASREVDEDALFSCITPITGPDKAAGIPARAKVQPKIYFTRAALESGKLERILKALDWLFSEEGILLTNYGIEGTHYEMVDGNPVVKEPYNADFATARSYGLIPSPIIYCFLTDSYMQYLMGANTYEDLDETGKSFVDGLNINDDYFYDKAPTLTTDAYMEYNELLEQQISLRDQYIMGKIDRDTYNQQYQELKDSGLQQIIDEAAQAYKLITE